MGKIMKFSNLRMGEKGMATIFDVANYFISQSRIEEGNIVTPLKLQKLCYYAQAWSLVWDDKELFNEDFEAWAHGPANYNLFDKYRDYKYNIIDEVDSDYSEDIFKKDQKETLEAIWRDYGIYEPKYLEELTHQEEPWIDARQDCAPGEICSNIITKQSMKEFYSKFLDG